MPCTWTGGSYTQRPPSDWFGSEDWPTGGLERYTGGDRVGQLFPTADTVLSYEPYNLFYTFQDFVRVERFNQREPLDSTKQSNEKLSSRLIVRCTMAFHPHLALRSSDPSLRLGSYTLQLHGSWMARAIFIPCIPGTVIDVPAQ